jgi:teichuronic acid biosynthesis glycosyltransferase TuaC
MRVLVVTNMFPTLAEPWFGTFVKEQVDDLRSAGVEVDVMSFDGRMSRREYVWAMRDVRRAVKRRHYDLVHAHYGLSGAVALAQRSAPVVTTFHGSDTGYVKWQRVVSWFVARRQPAWYARGTSDPSRS